MKRIASCFISAALLLTSALAEVSSACDLKAEKVGQIMGTKATTTPDGVVRVAWPRTDVKVQVDGMALHPFLGLGTWAAFQSGEHGSMVMGDTVVFQDEVNPAIDAAFAHGLEVTALHNRSDAQDEIRWKYGPDDLGGVCRFRGIGKH